MTTAAQHAWLLFALLTTALWLHALYEHDDPGSAFQTAMNHSPVLSRIPTRWRRISVSVLLAFPSAGAAAIVAFLAYLMMA